MTRIFIACDHALAMEVFSDELRREVEEPDPDVFVLMLSFSMGLTKLLRRRRFWRVAHEKLDAMLALLASEHAVSDGIASDGDPEEAVVQTMRSLRPHKVLAVCSRDRRRGQAVLEHAFARHAAGEKTSRRGELDLASSYPGFGAL